MTAVCAVGLGGNMGDPQAMLERAVNLLRLRPELEVAGMSSTWKTEPVGGNPGQDWFYNRVAVVHTDIEPIPLLRLLIDIEGLLGRVRVERWGPRLIDLDLLFRDQQTLDAPELVLPHPRLHERAFVLHPLAEVAPSWYHPILGLTVAEMLERLPEDGPRVERI
ncbi:MAG: 2-amino-4-hydroxy-6-hydroxymethyldihydropteridine diphosphokinase [Deltaproteobacteria bacterium]|jgi:2-amino-4-hydroxy-6-hydroxymethyldihydropteridine diphosphokinase|nr:2-amino-4-hydroxy-6-hydroxymethyldihydropteridine diphosphokinase [Deltaproteobacteria bacterium]